MPSTNPGNGSSKTRQKTTRSPAPLHGKSQPQTQLPHEAIAVRAYEMFIDRGSHEGHADDDWFAAERELTAKLD